MVAVASFEVWYMDKLGTCTRVQQVNFRNGYRKSA